MTSARCFVIQPFGMKKVGSSIHDNDKVYESLKKLEKLLPNFPIEIFRGDTEKVERDNLHSHVSDCINKSHFCIADFTGQNPNVLYETGYARGQKQKVIIITQNMDDIPTDLKGVIAVQYSMSNLGVLANDVQHHLDRVKGSVHKKLHDELERVPYISRRDDALIRSKIRGAKTRIDILQTNLTTLNYGFMDEIVAAVKAHSELELRILTLDPQSIFVNFRAQQLETDVRVFRNELTAALDAVLLKLGTIGGQVRVKLYDDFPAQIAFFFDQEIMACVVSAMGRSRDNCAFLVNQSQPGAQKSFVEHFEHLWNKKSVPVQRAFNESQP